MRAASTETIFDESRQLIQELYTSRYMENPPRAMSEIKLYHLPLSIASYGAPSIKDEVTLLSEKQVVPKAKSPCPGCGAIRPLYGEFTIQCLECWSITMQQVWKTFPTTVSNFQQIVQSPNYVSKVYSFVLKETWSKFIIAATLKELVASTRAALHDFRRSDSIVTMCWSTPKKNFLASEIGCLECGQKMSYQDNWIWSTDSSDWSNGYCPACQMYDRAHPTVWGMDLRAYAEWQDSYATSAKFHRTIARYGALALLLVSTSHEWVKFVKYTTPKTPSSDTLIPHTRYIGHVTHFVSKAKSLNDLGINL